MSNSLESRVFKSVVPQETFRTRLSSAFQSSLTALRVFSPAPFPANAHYVLDSDSLGTSEVELSSGAEHKVPMKLVHANIIDLDEIEICKQANGEDWLLGMGSYGMVSPSP